jgi:hypothetical protein
VIFAIRNSVTSEQDHTNCGPDIICVVQDRNGMETTDVYFGPFDSVEQALDFFEICWLENYDCGIVALTDELLTFLYDNNMPMRSFATGGI